MYFTFFKTNAILPKHPNFSELEQFLKGIEIPQEIHTKPEGYNLTIKKDDNDPYLLTYFTKHVDTKWYNIPTPPNFPTSELKRHYSSFKIPKRSGGLRQIDAPDEELKSYLRRLKLYFEDTLKILTHDVSHAYVKQRSTVTAIKVHQENESKWFLKLDISQFFPSHNKEYVMKTLEQIYPIGYLLKEEQYRTKFETAIEYAFLDGRLPQGTPLSPTLTNILMTPIDYEIQHMLWDKKNNYIYTRYADDMLISSKYNFKYSKIEDDIKSILQKFETPFKIKSEKTRYGSSAGSNWNLGIMLNKDNRMTIGHKENQRFRAMLFSIMKDYTNHIYWSPEDKAELGGKISYYKSIDPVYTQYTVQRYENRFNVSLKEILKN